jgi:gluconate 2-dehydrogenase subunit 3-like protein
MPMRDALNGSSRYPGYDVLSKRLGPSWNEQTRRVVMRRLSLTSEPRFFTSGELLTVAAIAACIVPQPQDRPAIPVAQLVDEKLHQGRFDGYRPAGMPRERDAWRMGLRALDAEASSAYGDCFNSLLASYQDHLIQRMASGSMSAPEWGSMQPKEFFNRRMAHDIVLAYYAHPTAWSEIGWGGPASPRGYVRLDFNERDPWEAAEARNGDDASVHQVNSHVR